MGFRRYSHLNQVLGNLFNIIQSFAGYLFMGFFIVRAWKLWQEDNMEKLVQTLFFGLVVTVCIFNTEELINMYKKMANTIIGSQN